MGAIKCHVGGRVYRVVFLIPPDLLPGYHAVWITLADDLEDGFTVEPRRLTAGRCLQMMRKTTGSREIFLAKRTRDIGATMGFGVEMLQCNYQLYRRISRDSPFLPSSNRSHS